MESASGANASGAVSGGANAGAISGGAGAWRAAGARAPRLPLVPLNVRPGEPYVFGSRSMGGRTPGTFLFEVERTCGPIEGTRNGITATRLGVPPSNKRRRQDDPGDVTPVAPAGDVTPVAPAVPTPVKLPVAPTTSPAYVSMVVPVVVHMVVDVPAHLATPDLAQALARAPAQVLGIKAEVDTPAGPICVSGDTPAVPAGSAPPVVTPNKDDDGALQWLKEGVTEHLHSPEMRHLDVFALENALNLNDLLDL